jgi:hypothetical protein
VFIRIYLVRSYNEVASVSVGLVIFMTSTVYGMYPIHDVREICCRIVEKKSVFLHSH